MKLIYRYICLNLIKTFALTTFVFLFIGFLTRVVHYSSIITQGGGSLSDFAKILLLIQPKIIVVFSPFTALISCFIIYQGLIHSNENTSVYNAGKSDFTLLIPFAYFATIIFLISFFFSSILVPYSYREMEKVHERLAINFSNSLLKPKNFINQKGITIFINETKEEKTAEGIIILDERDPAKKSILVSDTGNIWFNGQSIIFKAKNTYISRNTAYSTFPLISHFKDYLVSFHVNNLNVSDIKKSLYYKSNKILLQELKAGNTSVIKELKIRFGTPFFTILIPFSLIVCLFVFFNSTRSRISIINVIYSSLIVGYTLFSSLFGEIAFNTTITEFFLYFCNFFLIFTFLIFMMRTRIF